MNGLYHQHAQDTPAANDWIDFNGGDIDTVRAFGPIAEMRGTFTWSRTERYYRHTFTPDVNGKYRAITMPVYESGVMVDIIAFRANNLRKKLDVWGTVAEQATFLNHDAIYRKNRTAPLHICQTWGQWLRLGCTGVLPLCYSGLPLLRDAGDIAVDEWNHGFQLLHNVYIWPSDDPVAARIEGRKRIFVDDAVAA